MRDEYLLYIAALPICAVFSSYVLRWRSHDAAGRACTRTLGGIALYLTLQIPTFYAAVDRIIGIPNIARLLATSAGCWAGWAFYPFLTYLVNAPRSGHQERARGLLGSTGLLLTTIGALALCFSLALRAGMDATATGDFTARYGGLTAILVYALIYASYLGAMLFRSFLFGSKMALVTRSPQIPLRWRWQLRLQALGWGLAFLYWGHEGLRALLRYFTIGYPTVDANVVAGGLLVGSLLLLLSSEFFNLGRWWGPYRAYRRLYPLWRDLYRVEPAMAQPSIFAPRRSALSDTFAINAIDQRLDQRITEIRDGVLLLRGYIDTPAAVYATRLCQEAGQVDDTARTIIAAASLASAIRAKRARRPASAPLTTPILQDTADLTGEVTYLQQVALAYRHSSIVRAVLAWEQDGRETAATTRPVRTPGPSSTAGSARSRAIVIGGGMAGLWASRVLVDHFTHVTIIDQDRFPTAPTPRKGVPQARHSHIVLACGQRTLGRLFPGLAAELADAGAPTVDWTADCLTRLPAGWLRRDRSGLVTQPCSRDLLEWSVRNRLAADRRVRFLEGCTVTGLLSDDRRARVTGVRFRERDQMRVEQAELIVDASGRDSHAPEWLAALGYARPQETVVNAFLGYASRWYQRPSGFRHDWQALLIGNAPPDQPRGGVLYPVENGRWIVTLAGTARDYPPTDEAGFLDFARSLDTPLLYEVIKDAQPLSPIWGYRRMENRLRHYDRLTRWPEGFVTLGDAVCTLNPIYGQGMTVSALNALTLDRCLRELRRQHPIDDVRGLSRPFQRRLAKSNALPWLLATSEDFRWPTTEGGRPGASTRLMHRYLDRVLLAVPKHPAVQQVFLEVVHLLRPPTALFRPGILARVLVPATHQRSGRATPPAAAEGHAAGRPTPGPSQQPATPHSASARPAEPATTSPARPAADSTPSPPAR